jgi:hypothetical protein
MSRRSTTEIEQLLQGYRDRGELTRRAFCEKQGISLATLDYYLRRSRKHGKKGVRLARVELTPPEARERFALILTNGRRVECGAAGLAELIRTAEAI